MPVTVNFDNTYELITIEPDLSEATFYSITKNNIPVLLKIRIERIDIPLLPEVYNLSFGPINDDGTIDDKARINHQDLNKAFSTIILFALTYLKKNPNSIIGLDGSNDARAYLYHRMFLTNRTHLQEYFVALGVDWFARLLRKGQIELDSDGSFFFKPRPELINYNRSTSDLYMYYIFHLANNNE
jgi:hypothetical protein